MGFMTPTLPAVDHEAFVRLPLRDRIKILVLKWVDYGYGVPRIIHILYIAKLVVFYAIAGIAIATATSGLPAFWHVSQWWNQPIVYQKAILWTVLLEATRPRRIVGTAGGQDQADDRWLSGSGPGPTPFGCGHGGGCRSPQVTAGPGSTSRCTSR